MSAEDGKGWTQLLERRSATAGLPATRKKREPLGKDGAFRAAFFFCSNIA